jgi:hypothetical protein
VAVTGAGEPEDGLALPSGKRPVDCQVTPARAAALTVLITQQLRLLYDRGTEWPPMRLAKLPNECHRHILLRTAPACRYSHGDL